MGLFHARYRIWHFPLLNVLRLLCVTVLIIDEDIREHDKDEQNVTINSAVSVPEGWHPQPDASWACNH